MFLPNFYSSIDMTIASLDSFHSCGIFFHLRRHTGTKKEGDTNHSHQPSLKNNVNGCWYVPKQ